MPGHAASTPPPTVHVQTTVEPDSTWSGWTGMSGYSGWRAPYGYHPGYAGYHPGYSFGYPGGFPGRGWYPGSGYIGGPGGFGWSGHWNTGPSWHTKTTVIQSGPSKASGNYYQSSTADPTASGGYYAGKSGGAFAMPVLSNPATQPQWWGPGGSPFGPPDKP